MEFDDVLQQRRTVRLFQQKKVGKDKIEALLNAARLSSCAMNKQVLRYEAVHAKNMVKKIFDGTLWAAMVRPHRTPVWGETAPDWFIVIHGPQEKDASYVKFDVGSAVMSMEFQAQNFGLGCCWLGSFKADEVSKLLELGDDRQVYAVVAVGYPAETPQYENISADADQSYYLDENKRLTVPKYTVDAICRFYED